MEVQLLRLPDLAPVATQPLGSEQVIPRSVLLAGFEGSHHHLLVGLGDGTLHSWRLDPAAGRLSGRSCVRAHSCLDLRARAVEPLAPVLLPCAPAASPRSTLPACPWHATVPAFLSSP
jgi:hypothetical protein